MPKKQPAVAEALNGCGSASMGCGCVIMLIPLIGGLLLFIVAVLGAAAG